MTRTLRNTLLATGAALILSTGVAAAAPATAQSAVNLRSGPGTEYPVVGTLRAGETVDVAGCTGSWCQVSGPSGSGFASRNYLAMAGGAPSVGVAVAPGYVEGGYAYNDDPGYGYDDGYYGDGYGYGPGVGVFVGGRFGHRRDFDHRRGWNGAWNANRSGAWQGARSGTWQGNRSGTFQGRTGFSGNRVGGAAPGSVTPMNRSAPNMSAPTGLHGGAGANAGARVGGGVHVGGGGGRDHH